MFTVTDTISSTPVVAPVVTPAPKYVWTFGSTAILFTGQHMSYSETLSVSNLVDLVGLIVVSDGTYKTLYNQIRHTGKDGITINDAHPVISLSSSRQQPTVYGVVTHYPSEKQHFRDDGSLVYDHETDYEFERDIAGRIRVNSLGDGAIWVCNQGGNVRNGDYVTSSDIPGYGCRQSSEFLANYTVAKSTCSVDFDTDLSILEDQFQTRYLTPCGDRLTREAYTACLQRNEPVYLAVFIGCTYHCG